MDRPELPHRANSLNFANSILRSRRHYSIVQVRTATQSNMAAAQADGDVLVFLADDFDPSPADCRLRGLPHMTLISMLRA